MALVRVKISQANQLVKKATVSRLRSGRFSGGRVTSKTNSQPHTDPAPIMPAKINAFLLQKYLT